MKPYSTRVMLVLFVLCSAAMVFGQVPDPKGWWKFDDVADPLRPEAGFGVPLQLVGTHATIDGPAAGNGAITIGTGSHYKVQHGMATAEGDSLVNEYTLMFDFRVSALNKWYTFFQTASANDNDGDCFINKTGNIGVGATGYVSYSIAANEWYRLVISVKNGTHYRYYLDGYLVKDAPVQEKDGRLSLEPTLLIFGDDDGDDAPIDVAEVGIWDKALTSWQIKALGGFGHEQTAEALQPDGLWKFDNADNLSEALYGKDLVLTGTELAVEGPSEQDKAVRNGIGSYYTMETLVAPNGGGALINEYTFQVDFKVPALGVYYCFWQTAPDNSNDGDIFINPDGQIGVRATGYTDLKIVPNEWYRLVVSVKNGSFYNIYLDKQLVRVGDVQAVDGRFSLADKVLLFADEDGEDAEFDVAAVGFWGRALADSEVVMLGGYSHETKAMVGNWKFDDAGDILKAEMGSPLELVGSHTALEGPAAGNGAVQLGVGSHYKMNHGIPASGGTKVNEYTLHADIRIQALTGWHTIFQTTEANNNDGDCFVKSTGVIGVGDTGYSLYKMLANEWYRLVISVKNGSHYSYYLDGQLVLEAPVQAVDGRFALEPILLMFGDDDGDDGLIDCAEISIWNYALTADEVAALGGFGHKTGVLSEEPGQLVSRYEVFQNYPNPFNPQTTIGYALVAAGEVRLDVYNMLGQRVATLVDERQESGQHTVRFNAAALPTGIYLYKLSVNGFTQSKKMFLVK